MRLDSNTKINNRYVGLNWMASGGMAEIYEAYDTNTHHKVVVKIPKQDIICDVKTMKMFQHELMAIKRLDHPAIIPLLDQGEVEVNGMKLPCMVMPFIEGESLQSVLNEEGKGLTLTQALKILEKVTEGLNYAHSQKIFSS